MTDSTSTPAGDAGSTETAAQAPAAPSTPDAAANAAQSTTEPPAAPAAPAAGDDNPWTDPDKAKAEIEKLRRENGAARTQAKADAAEQARQDLAQTIGKALGLVKDDADTVDPAKLAAQAQAAARDAAVELAVFKAAGPLNANPQTLLDSRSFVASLADVDPTDTQAVTAAITAAVNADARFKVTQAATRSGGDLPGGTGEGAVTKETFASMSNAEKNALFKTNPTLFRTLAGA